MSLVKSITPVSDDNGGESPVKSMAPDRKVFIFFVKGFRRFDHEEEDEDENFLLCLLIGDGVVVQCRRCGIMLGLNLNLKIMKN